MMDIVERATHIEVSAEVRYWEDAEVNGVEDETGNLIPGRVGDDWKARIALASGKVEGWPAGTSAKVHYKVCDAGQYWLTDESGDRIAKWSGYYVPNDFLCHGDDGFGDYIILNIGPDGTIADYDEPEIDLARWKRLPTPHPHPEGSSH